VPRRGHAFAVVSGDWKLVQPCGMDEANQKHIRDSYAQLCREQGRKENDSIEGPARYELYNLATDPGETTDLAAKHPEIVSKLKAQYDAWFTQVAKRWENTDAYKQPMPGESFWFPQQKAPVEITPCQFDFKSITEHMLAESLSGLAAQSVNDGTGKEMLWLPGGGGTEWYPMMLKRLKPKVNQEADVWDLVKKFAGAGIVKGYILFDEDTSTGKDYDYRPNINISANIATVLAGVLQGVMVERKSEGRAQQLGLKKLVDAALITKEQCFEKYKDQLNNHLVLAVDPKTGQNRDVAIAQRAMTIYGTGDFENKVMQWMVPLSPVLGWNCGGESEHTGMVSRWGHFNTASNFMMNLPLLSAESWSMKIDKAASVDPRAIDYKDPRSCHAFIMTDGDNLTWLTRSFIKSPNFWANPRAPTIPMSWTTSSCTMSMANPYAWNTFVSTQRGMSLLEYGGGYAYPDVFAKNRPNREALLRQFAKRINEHLQRTGVKMFGFICLNDRWSADAKVAFNIFAQELDGIAGMVAVQYNPYQDGKGEIFWVRNRNGDKIPVLAPKYAVWANLKKPTSANPQKIARFINKDATAGQNFNLTIVHAWSWFKKDAAGNVLDAEKGDEGAQTGVLPIQWCKEKLTNDVKVAPLDELLWRIRMQHDPATTKKLLDLK